MKSIYILLFIFSINNTFSQIYSGIIKDASTDQPLAFVNIGKRKIAD